LPETVDDLMPLSCSVFEGSPKHDARRARPRSTADGTSLPADTQIDGVKKTTASPHLAHFGESSADRDFQQDADRVIDTSAKWENAIEPPG
jgi:hypothetical protein